METLLSTVRRTLNWVATIVALIITVVLPAVYYVSAYSAEESAVRTEAEINAYIVNQLINANPEMWRYEDMRLTEMLSGRPREGHAEIRLIVDTKGRIIARSMDRVPTPILTRRAPLQDSGVTVGWLEVSRSLRGVLMRTVVIGLLGLMLGILVFFPLRLLPLHAMERMLGELREVTERKRAEEALRESEDKYRHLVEDVSDWVWETDENIVFTYSSPRVRDIIGYEPNEIVGHTPFDFMSQEQAQQTLDGVKSYVEQVAPIASFSNAMLRKDGGTAVVEFGGFPIFDVAGIFCGYRGTARDITDRVRAEEALRERLEFEKVLMTISVELINSPLDQIDSRINRALRVVGEYMGVDRCHVYQFDETAISGTRTHEWCAEGAMPAIDVLKMATTQDYGWFAERMATGEPLVIPRLSDLPEEAQPGKGVLMGLGVKSLTNVPMICQGRFIGFVGFESVGKEKAWTEEGVALLKIVGEILLNAMERQRGEEALRESEDKYRRLVEDVSDFVFEVDENMVLTYGSPKVRDILGYEPEEIVGRPATSFVPPNEAEKMLNMLAPIFEARGPVPPMVFNMLRKDGSNVTVEFNGSPIFDSNGVFGGYLGTARDITERKRAEEERDMSLARLEALWNLAQMKEVDESELYEVILAESVTLTGSKYGLIARVSEDGRTLTLKFLTPEVGRDCHIPDGRVLEMDRLTILDKPVREKTYVIDNECKVVVESRLPSGHVAIERVLAAPILSEGIVREVLVVANKPFDYNEQDANQLLLLGAGAASLIERRAFEEKIKELTRTLERRVAERTAELEEVNRGLEAFTYSVSHDLRSPLRSIDGFSLAIMEDYSDKLDNVGLDYLVRVRAATQRMGHLIDDLLRLSRVTRTEIKWADVNLSNLAREILAELQKSAPERNMELVVQPDVVVWGDPALLRIAMNNLLHNAWKFTGKKLLGKIEFGCVSPKGERVCFVRDNGVGFDSKYADKLFQPFQRLHAEGDFSGTGIGLAMAKRIIGRHGGQIWAEGAVDQGAAFYFTIMRPKRKKRRRLT